MRLNYYYWVLVVLWHALLLLAAYFLFQEAYYWFMLLQPVALLSLYWAYRIYRHFQKPLELVESGKGALQDRDFSVKFRATGAPEVDALVDTYNTMIDTLREERTQLQEQHYFLQKLIDASPSGILIMDHDGAITEANPWVCELLGFDPSAVDAEEQQTHSLLAAARELAIGERQQITLDSTNHFRLQASAFIDRGFHRKFVQVEALTQEILAAEKRAYGKVIRMMAHEVNNSIGAINALLDTLTVPADQADEDWVKDVQESLPIAMKRNQRLNTFMRNFADVVRLPAPHFERVDLVQLVNQVSGLFQAQAQQQQIQLERASVTDFASSGRHLFIQADPHQLEQALVNILKNALESVGQNGTVRIELQLQPLTLIIADNGPGLSSEAAEQIFTPFFTSKPNGQGIGLTLVREILMSHDYHFNLSTDDDGWTRFVIRF
ncbi:MAG: ATP-binding protein [Bacteroidota bacterium]